MKRSETLRFLRQAWETWLALMGLKNIGFPGSLAPLLFWGSLEADYQVMNFMTTPWHELTWEREWLFHDLQVETLEVLEASDQSGQGVEVAQVAQSVAKKFSGVSSQEVIKVLRYFETWGQVRQNNDRVYLQLLPSPPPPTAQRTVRRPMSAG